MKTVNLAITNIDKGPRGVNAARGGTILVDPGQTVEVELTEAEAADLSKDWFSVKGKAKDDAADGTKSYEDMTRAELDALAAERGVDTAEAKNKGDVIAALQLADEA